MTRPAEWLSGAAAQTFLAMAVLTSGGTGGGDMLCSPGHGAPLSGMTAMYLLMAAFHAAPWLKGAGRLIEGRGC